MKGSFKKRFISITAVCALVCVCLFALSCARATTFKFVPDELELFVGDERDLSLYAVFTPAVADERDFTVKTDGDCVEVYGTRIKAVKPGACTVTAKLGEKKAKLSVTVSYRAPQELMLDVEGETVRTLGNSEPIKFYAYLDDYCDQDITVSWTVNGEPKGTDGEYVFEPSAVGEYAVVASAAGLTNSATVLVYSETAVTGHSDGELIQHRDFSPVRFYATESVDFNNPRSTYAWTVNGEIKSTKKEFEFVPLSLGNYEVGLVVNGVKRTVDGGEFATVVATGDRAPNGYIDFDDADGVFVRWADGAVARSVAIVNGNGERTVYNSADSRYTHLFGNGYFDVSEMIAPFSGLPKTYTITVYADAAGEPFEFTQYPYDAEKYIKENVLCRNSFLSGEAQAAEWVHELYAVGKLKAEGYLSRECLPDKDDIAAAVISAADELGIFASTSIEGNILSVEFLPYVNAPSVFENPSSRQARIYIPHFEMTDSAMLRPRNYMLAIERAEKEVSVENSEQLLIAVMRGVLPVPVAESPAANIYSDARGVLLNMIGRNYTDEQKAHAVYDWLQFCTLCVSGENNASVANYLDGVFGGGSDVPALVVSDLGAAKAYAFLCGMEGIPCRIVNNDGDYYNTVEIGGLWYIVDVYDGEAVSGSEERCTHAGLFLAGEEPSEKGACYDGSFMFYLQKHAEGGAYYDCYIDGDDDDDVIKAAVFGTFGGQSRKSFKFKLPNGSSEQYNIYYGIEFLLDADLSAEQKSGAVAIIEEAAAEYIKAYVEDNYDGEDVLAQVDKYLNVIRVTRLGDLVWVTAQIPSFPIPDASPV